MMAEDSDIELVLEELRVALRKHVQFSSCPQGITKHVAGMVNEIAEGTYQMEVVSTVDDSVACTLTNSVPVVKGPHNTVTATCTAPAAVGSTTGTSTNAVINVTGP